MSDKQWFLDVVMADVLTSNEPNYLDSKWMTSDGEPMEFACPYDYYIVALDYADRIGIPAFDIVNALIVHPDHLEYFLRGEEYEELFRRYFSVLTPEESLDLIALVDKSVDRAMECSTEAYLKVRNYIYLSRRLRGYPCERLYDEDVDKRLLSLHETVIVGSYDGFHSELRADYVEAGIDRVNAERAAAGLVPIEDLDDPEPLEELIYDLEQEFVAPFDAAMDANKLVYAKYFDSLVEEDPRQDVILM
jgi:hypothetical protein